MPRAINVKGAHKVQPDTRSNKPIPIAPASAPFFGPKRIDTMKSIAVPKWTKPPFAAIGSRIFKKDVETKTSAMSIADITKSNVRVLEFESKEVVCIT